MMAAFSLQWQGFVNSLTAYVQNFSFHTLVMAIMMVFMILGLIDKLRGNKWGYGEAFDNAFHTMGPLTLCMAGAIAAAPLLCELLSPLVTPLYRAIGASPALLHPPFWHWTWAGTLWPWKCARAMKRWGISAG